jgi:hypothetical protein
MRSRRGFLLVVAVSVTTLPLILLLQVSLSRSMLEVRHTERALERSLAFARAEGVMNDALRSFAQSGTLATWTCAALEPFGAGTSSCAVLHDVTLPSGRPAKKIRVQGYVPNQTTLRAMRELEAIIQQPNPSPFTRAAFGVNQIIVRSGGYLSSGRSSPGGFTEDAQAERNAVTQTNSTSTTSNAEAIRLGSDSALWGTATVGSGVPPSAAIWLASSPAAMIKGTNSCTQTPEVCFANSAAPPPLVPASTAALSGSDPFPACSGGASLTYCVATGAPGCTTEAVFTFNEIATGNNCNLTLVGDGQVVVNRIDIGGSNNMALNGNITLIDKGTTISSFLVGSLTNLTVGSGKRVTVHAHSRVDFSGGGTVNNSGTPNQFTLQVTGAGLVELGGGATVRGLIYAPESTVNIGTGGSTTLYGAVIADVVDLKADSRLYYDRRVTQDPSSRANVVSWREVIPGAP